LATGAISFSIFNAVRICILNIQHLFLSGLHTVFLNVAIFYLAKKIAEKLGVKSEDALYLAFAFVFASVYHQLTLISWSWHFAQVVVTFLLLLSIYEYLSKKRFWLIGIYFGSIFMTRFVAGFGILFFVLMIVKDVKSKIKIKYLMQLVLPVVASGIVLLIYNYIRFGDVWENGYRLANFSDWQKDEILNHGLFKLSNIPSNFYHYFIKALEYPYLNLKYPGVSFFIVSPFFLYIFKADLKNKIVIASTLTFFVILVALLSYYWPGWKQVGPRYMVDVLPFLYLMLVSVFKKHRMALLPKLLIMISSVINLYLFFGIFNV
jgi:hypothetical protein